MKPIWIADFIPNPDTKKLVTILRPKNIRCYDNGGESCDRYTVVFTRMGMRFHYPYICMSANPTHPHGAFSRGEAKGYIDRPKYAHLGKKIKFQDLPKNIQVIIHKEYNDLYSD